MMKATGIAVAVLVSAALLTACDSGDEDCEGSGPIGTEMVLSFDKSGKAGGSGKSGTSKKHKSHDSDDDCDD